MFETKLEVDRHVESCLRKINNETERNLKCMAFARLYFKVGSYEEARRYVTAYLTVKPLSADALSLLGKVLEKLGRREAALDAFKKSFEIDPKQSNIVLKVCELFSSENIAENLSSARYFCDKAQTFDPHNPIVFNLKELLTIAESQDPGDVSRLLSTELASRPNDAQLRVRYLRHLLQNNQTEEAYKHVCDFEQKGLSIFLNNLNWYEVISEVLIRYQRDNAAGLNLTWEFWVLLVSVLDKLVVLTLDESLNNSKTASECVSVVFNFDQTLDVAVRNVENCSERSFIQEFISHYRAQLCFHLGTLLFKQAKLELVKYKDAMQMALPLLFVSFHTQPADLRNMWLDYCPEVRKRQIQRWNQEAAFRCSQAGHILQAASKDKKVTFMERAMQSCSGLWREQLFKKLFVTRDQQAKLKSSYFISNQHLLNITVRLPDSASLVKYDEIAQLIHPDSIHHLIWICMNRKLHTFKCTVFSGLQYSVKNLNNASAESLSILDIDAFLYCTTLCVQQTMEEMKQQIYCNPDKPQVLPVAVTNQLGTLNQSKWITSAYRIYRNEYGSDFNALRLTLIRGIEVVRCIGNHGLDVKLLIILARAFSERAKHVDKQSEVDFNEARAELYWKAVLPLLEKLLNNQAIAYGNNRLFEYKSKEMSLLEITNYIDEGKLFNATQLMKKKDYEKAIDVFENLKSPYASFYQAQIYKAMADEQVNQHKENVTSEMRSQHIILLSKTRDCLYLTLDRLRDPSVDRKHPLNAQLGTEIEKIERLLSRIDPDVYIHRNECDGMSDENVSSAGSVGDHVNNTVYPNVTSLFYPNESSTPQFERAMHSNRYRFEMSSRREARPSPERLDAQLRQMQSMRDVNMTHILEQNRLMVESCRNMVEELKSIKEIFTNLHSTLDDVKSVKQYAADQLHDFRDVAELVREIKREVAELKKDSAKPKPNQLSEEDLYVLDEEYGNDYVLNSNVPNFTASNLYQNYQPRMPPTNSLNYPAAATLYPGLYPMYPYTNLGLPQASALQFGQDPQIPDFRTINPLTQPNYAQPGITTNKSPWEVAGVGVVQTGMNQLNLMQPPALTIPQPPQPSQAGVGLFKDTLISSTPSSSLGLFSSIANIPTPASNTFTTASAASNKNTPVVIITSSDPLPKATIQTTQVLSVTIPPQHLKGNQPPKSQPHNYQIQLPSNSGPTFSTTPSIINQPPLIVTTQGLLSNVAPPIYSAIDSKSPSKNTSLGLQIEKSLNQSFGITSRNDSLNKSNISSISLEEHDPCPDFKPIIPLPDEVPINTGEENETVLFCERGKLFRFTEREWRERGIGNIKILQNKNTGKIRILMRRDQVHKICANHFLTKDMVLTPMQNTGRAYIWAAHDFADGEVVIEKLCVRFKTEEQASDFYAAFEKARKGIPDEEDAGGHEELAKVETTANPVKTSAEITASLGGFKFTSTPTFKPKDQISIPKVTVQPETKTSPFATFTFGAKQTPPAGVATNLFSSTSTTEFKPVQMTPKSPDAGEGDEFVPTLEFTPVVPLPELVDVKTGEENAEILFESRAKLLRFDSTGKEWKEKGVGIMKVLKENNIRLVMRREQVHKVCCNHILFKNNMSFTKMPNNPKAITWYAQDFSEGTLKTEMFAVRFKSEEQTDAFYKAVTAAQELLDANNLVKSDKKVAIPEIKSDDLDNSKVKSKEEKKVKSEVKVEIAPLRSSSWCDKFKTKLANWECKNCFTVNEGHNHVCETCETVKPSASPKKLGTPETPGLQFSFSSPAAGDITQKSQFSFGGTPVTATTTSSTSFLFGQNLVTSSSSSTASWGDAFKPRLGTWECQSCFVRNEGDNLYCVACDSPKDNTVPKKETKESVGVNLDTPGLQFSFGIAKQEVKPTASVVTTAAVSTITSSSWGDAFKPKAGSWECQQCLVRNAPDKIYCISCDNPKDDSVPKKDANKGISLETPGLQFNFGIPTATTTSTFTFASKPTFSFAAQSVADSTTTNVSKPFSFTVTKQDNKETSQKDKSEFTFGSPQKHAFEFTSRSPRRQSGGQGEEESDASLLEDEGDHIYFKPVIPLPDKVEVKTGEEQEDVLYCHRAKLFRFVQGEWKERGIGDLKILTRPDTGRLRVLMRREHVFKICLNHILTSDIEYLPKDDKTWLFSAPDFSEGEINHWQFCVRFKTDDIAKEFKKAIDDALKSTSTSSETKSKAASSEDDSDVEFVSETKVTPEEEQEALKLKLPPKFMAYRQLPDCCCETCKKEDEILNQLYKTKAIASATTATSLFGTTTSIFGTPCKPFGASTESVASGKFIFGQPFGTNTSNIFGSSATPTTPTSTNLSKSETLKDMLMKPSVLGNIVSSKTPETPKNLFSKSAETKTPPTDAMKNFSFSFKTDNITTPTVTTNLFSQNKTSMFDNKTDNATTPTTGNIFSNNIFERGNNIFGGFATTPTTTPTTTAGNIFGPSTPGDLFATPTTSANAQGGNIFGAKSLFSTATNVPSNLFGSGGGNVTAQAPQGEEKKEAEIVLKCDSNLSFANLAAATSGTKAFEPPPADDSSPFSFLGSGAPVFASLNKTPKSKKGDKEKTQHSDDEGGAGSDGEAEGGEGYDPHFEPIVPLPDAIVVSTGEEDETPIFNERAKLYRYDNQTKEWKERGVGQMKIYHHPVKGTYRFLLRREQVHKAVLNMLITPNIELQPLTMSDKAWLWYGHNYSDDESAWEQLAVRFKTCQLAAQFHAAVQQAVQSVKEQQENKDLPSSIQNYGQELESSQDDDVIEGQEDDYDDDDERTITFSKQCNLSEQLPNGEWKHVGSGELQVYYDSDIYGSRMLVVTDEGHMLSNTLIGINTEMNVHDDHSCIWRAVEWTEVQQRWRTLKASFSDQQSAEELYCSYLQSIQYAHECDLVDDILGENSDIDEN